MGLFDFVRRQDKDKREPPPVQPKEFKGKRTFRRPPQHQEGIVCPFCMERFPLGDLEFRSISELKVRSTSEGEQEDKGYAQAVDDKYVAFWEDVNRPARTQEQNFVLTISDRENVTAVCFWDGKWIKNIPEEQAHIQETIIKKKEPIWQVKDKFGNIASQRICPHCHNNLPDVIGKSPHYIISMMGNTYSGKTVYLYRLLLSLLNDGFLPGWELTVDISFTDPNVQQNSTDIEANLEKMFESRKTGSKDTATGKLASATPITYICPIIITLRKGYENALVTLFDFPGEAIWRLRRNQEPFFKTLMNRINENASGWLFMLDSTTMPSVRQAAVRNGDQEYLQDTDDPTLNAKPNNVLLEFTRIFGAGNQIKAPVALVFSKADMIARYAEQLDQVSADSPFLKHSPHSERSKVDLDDLWQCDQAIREFLKGDPVLKTAKNLCRQYAWFAASATGVPVKAGWMGSETAPALRVVEPLEWLLWVLGAYAGEYSYENLLWNISTAPDANQEG